MRAGYVVADGGIPIYGSKGASVHVREFVRALGEDHEVDLFCAALGGEPHRLPVHRIHAQPRPQIATSGDTALDRDRTRVAVVDAVAASLGAAHAEAPYDFIYERYSLFSTAGLSVARAADVPLLLEVNAPLILERRRVEPLPLAALAQERERSVFREADAVLCVSEAVALYAQEQGARSDRVQVLRNAVDVTRFHPGISGDRVRRRHGLGDALVVGFAGSLKPWHGVDGLIDAFRRASEPNWRLLIVGDGPERSRLRELVSEMDLDERVLLVGAVHHDEVPAYVAAFDIAAAPYRGSPDFYFSPLKVYEYLAAGRAILASDIGQISSVIGHLDNGFLLPPDDVNALSDGLRRLADDPELRHSLQERAPLGLTTWKQVTGRVVEIATRARRAA